jgi:hypothetical protein
VDDLKGFAALVEQGAATHDMASPALTHFLVHLLREVPPLVLDKALSKAATRPELVEHFPGLKLHAQALARSIELLDASRRL